MAGKGIDFTRSAAAAALAQAGNKQASTATDRPKSQFWLNVGYTVPEGAEDGSDLFINLPYGLPLDDMEPVKTNGQNQHYVLRQHARNDLYKQIMEAANNLQPGQTVNLQLEVQIRRVGEESEAPAPEANPFGMKLSLVG